MRQSQTRRRCFYWFELKRDGANATSTSELSRGLLGCVADDGGRNALGVAGSSLPCFSLTFAPVPRSRTRRSGAGQIATAFFPAARLLDRWTADGPPLEWKIDALGKGMSSVAVADGKLFT